MAAANGIGRHVEHAEVASGKRLHQAQKRKQHQCKQQQRCIAGERHQRHTAAQIGKTGDAGTGQADKNARTRAK